MRVVINLNWAFQLFCLFGGNSTRLEILPSEWGQSTFTGSLILFLLYKLKIHGTFGSRTMEVQFPEPFPRTVGTKISSVESSVNEQEETTAC